MMESEFPNVSEERRSKGAEYTVCRAQPSRVTIHSSTRLVVCTATKLTVCLDHVRTDEQEVMYGSLYSSIIPTFRDGDRTVVVFVCLFVVVLLWGEGTRTRHGNRKRQTGRQRERHE